MKPEKPQSSQDEDPDRMPNFTPEAIARMKRLKQALLNGNYDEVFAQEFPPEKNYKPADEQ
jgi:hypothetical protein